MMLWDCNFPFDSDVMNRLGKLLMLSSHHYPRLPYVIFSLVIVQGQLCKVIA